MGILPRLATGNSASLWWSSLALVFALALAVLSSAVRLEGRFYASAFLAALALLAAFGAGAVLIPKLLLRVKVDYLNQLRFFRFTRRGAVFLALVLLVGSAAANTGNNLLILVLSALVAAIVVSGTIANLVLYGIHVSLSMPESIYAEQQAVFFLTLHNLKRFFPSFAVRLRSRATSGESSVGTDLYVQEKNFPYVRPGEKLRANLLCRFRRRGVYPIDGFEVTTTFPFGFFSRGRRIEAEGSIVVYPGLVDLGLFLRSHPFLHGEKESSYRGWGGGLYNIRRYVGGDSTRFIHWKSTAKVGQLMIKDFTSVEDQPLHVAFSTWLPRRDDHSLGQFEKAVSCLASLAHLWRAKGQVFSFDSGEFRVEVGGGEGEYGSLMEYLACVAPASEMRLDLRRIQHDTIVFLAGSQDLGCARYVDYLRSEALPGTKESNH